MSTTEVNPVLENMRAEKRSVALNSVIAAGRAHYAILRTRFGQAR
jgi:hypothetical protein